MGDFRYAIKSSSAIVPLPKSMPCFNRAVNEPFDIVASDAQIWSKKANE